jgi:cellulose synthase/poly-beta-1,6-N-acetylglucosamine synthase-like glycosyltransferase
LAGDGATTHNAPHSRAAIIIPCIRIDPLTIKCVTTAHHLFPQAEILVLADVADNENVLAKLATVIVTGPVTIAKKRNLGAQRTNRSVIAFIDSDAYPERGWLDNAVKGLDDYPEVVAVAGPNVSPLNEPLSELYVGIALKSSCCALDAHIQKRKGPQQFIANAPSCNFIIQRSVYMSLGGMDESLFGGEDIELCARLTKESYQILYLPDVLVYHKNRRLLPFIKQRLAFGGFIVNAITVTPSAKLLITLLPAWFVLFLLTGMLIPYVSWWGGVYLAIVGLYCLILLVESLRHAPKLVYVPGAFIAMMVATTAPGIGIWAKLLRLLPHSKKFYRNDE